MGGCIVSRSQTPLCVAVSSLYGRVYHLSVQIMQESVSFLPVWEGVSGAVILNTVLTVFPPCMGGCIELVPLMSEFGLVSSLYGRVYRYAERKTWQS